MCVFSMCVSERKKERERGKKNEIRNAHLHFSLFFFLSLLSLSLAVLLLFALAAEHSLGSRYETIPGWKRGKKGGTEGERERANKNGFLFYISVSFLLQCVIEAQRTLQLPIADGRGRD